MANKLERSLTWKYFWQQKITEVGLTLLIIVSIIFIPYLLGHNIGNNAICGKEIGNSTDGSDWRSLDQGGGIFKDIELEECLSRGGILKQFGVEGQWFEGIMYIIVGLFWIFMISAVLALIYFGIEEWMQSNWKKAKKRARAEIRKTKRDALSNEEVKE